MIDQVSKEEIAYIAGLLEGEGSFYFNGDYTPIISIQMTDRDIIEKAQAILGGTGNIYTSLKGKNKTAYVFRVYGAELAIQWMRVLYPLMGKRRQERIDEIINYWDNRLTKSERMRQFNTDPEVALIKRLAKYKNVSFEEAKKIFDKHESTQ